MKCTFLQAADHGGFNYAEAVCHTSLVLINEEEISERLKAADSSAAFDHQPAKEVKRHHSSIISSGKCSREGCQA